MVVVIPALGGGDIRIKSSSPPCSDSQFEQANLESKRLSSWGVGGVRTTRTDGRPLVSPVSWFDSDAAQRLRCPNEEENSLRECRLSKPLPDRDIA